MMDFVSWDYEIPNIWKVIKHVPVTTNQSTTPFSLGMVEANHTISWKQTFHNFAA